MEPATSERCTQGVEVKESALRSLGQQGVPFSDTLPLRGSEVLARRIALPPDSETFLLGAVWAAAAARVKATRGAVEVGTTRLAPERQRADCRTSVSAVSIRSSNPSCTALRSSVSGVLHAVSVRRPRIRGCKKLFSSTPKFLSLSNRTTSTAQALTYIQLEVSKRSRGLSGFPAEVAFSFATPRRRH